MRGAGLLSWQGQYFGFRGRRGLVSTERSVRGAGLLSWQVQYFGLLMFDFVASAAL